MEAAPPTRAETNVVCLRCTGRGDDDIGRCAHCFDPLPPHVRHGLCGACWGMVTFE